MLMIEREHASIIVIQYFYYQHKSRRIIAKSSDAKYMNSNNSTTCYIIANKQSIKRKVMLTTTHLHPQSREDWQTVVIIASVVHFIGITFYAIYASGELQDWATDGDAVETYEGVCESIHFYNIFYLCSMKLVYDQKVAI